MPVNNSWQAKYYWCQFYIMVAQFWNNIDRLNIFNIYCKIQEKHYKQSLYNILNWSIAMHSILHGKFRKPFYRCNAQALLPKRISLSGLLLDFLSMVVEGTIVPKFSRSCSKNSHVRIVCGPRRTNAGTNPLVKTI